MMTEEQQRVADWCAEELARYENHNPATDLDQMLIKTMHIALTALTQPASPALKLPENISVRTAITALDNASAVTTIAQVYKMAWNACIAETKRLNATHTSPIEPICATGGAEWVKCSERMPRSNETVQFYVADDKAIKQGRFISDSWHQEQDWCESSYGGMIDSEVCGNITHWMPLPAAPEEK